MSVPAWAEECGDEVVAMDLDDAAAGDGDVVEPRAREIDQWHRVAKTAGLPDVAEATTGIPSSSNL